MLSAILLACFVLSQDANSSTPRMIRHVEVEGSFRFPQQTILFQLSESPGKPFDAGTVREDIERLHGLGIFETVQVDGRDAGAGLVDLIYRLRERLFVSVFSLDGAGDAMADLLSRALRKEGLEMVPGTPFRPDRAAKAADAVRRLLMAHKHPMAEVETRSERHGNQVQVVLRVRPGPRIEIGEVHFRGNRSIPARDLLRRMGNARPASLLTRWTGTGCYLPDELGPDLENVRRLYRERGFAAAAVGKAGVATRSFPARWHFFTPWVPHERAKIELRIPIVEGPLYTVRSVSVEGDAGTASSDISRLVPTLRFPSRYDYGLLETARARMLAALGHHGYALAQVDLDQRFGDAGPEIDVVYRISAGDPMLIGRIGFAGTMRVPDKFLRRELRLMEGDTYDSSNLDKSVERLNRSGLIQEMRRDDVSLQATHKPRTLDVVFKIRERDRYGVYGTGGTGGAAGGYLGVIFTALNLMGLSEKLSFELDGGSGQSNAFLNLAMNHFLGGPYSLGFSLAHRLTGLNASSIVPGPQQVVNVLRMRSTGGAVQGTYHMSTKAAAGLGIQMERESVLSAASAAGGGGWASTPRATLQPSLVFDSTGGSARPVRGLLFAVAPAWSAPLPLRAVDTLQQSARLRLYRPDPWSGGRNQFAFQFSGMMTRPLGSGFLPVERRLFPAEETVRGFAHGAISPWSYDPSAQEADRQLQPASSDTVLALSAEYRVPISGALSGAAFTDLGWTGLKQNSLASPDSTSRIISKTNRILRASAGGELRVVVPGMNQPVRLIVAWNPLRLNTYFSGVSGLRRLADASHSIRFALGNVY